MTAFGGAYAGRTVLVTGHTGFKGSWLSLWLQQLGAKPVGLALDPLPGPGHFAACRVMDGMTDLRADVLDYEAVVSAMERHRPSLVFHLAAQPLVRRAFADPRETFAVNVMGTVNVLEAARRCSSVEAVVAATSDKAYRNLGWDWGYRETDPLGGHEPYAGSKACAEVVAEVYRQHGFQDHAVQPRRMAVASARAGNVIGGGDWAPDRLIPDVVRAIAAGQDVVLRNPGATRPWQHVLDCLDGYLLLGAKLLAAPDQHADAWNFGPAAADALPAQAIVERLLRRWPGHGTGIVVRPDPPGKEAQALRLDSSKAAVRLRWAPRWTVGDALDRTADWYRQHAAGTAMHTVSVAQIAEHEGAAP